MIVHCFRVRIVHEIRFKVVMTWRGDPLSFSQRGLLNHVLRLVIDVHESVKGLFVHLRRWAFVLTARFALENLMTIY